MIADRGMLREQIKSLLYQQYERPTFNPTFRGSFQESAHFFYKEARNLYIANIVLNNQLKNISQEKRFLEERLNSLLNNTHFIPQENKPKRIRRKAVDIARDFNCRYCEKAYGSEGSLSQHMRLKHADAVQVPEPAHFKKEVDEDKQ